MRAPTAVCFLVADVHWLASGSPGATWLTALVDALPANGHVLLASRWWPAVRLARLAAQDAVGGGRPQPSRGSFRDAHL